MADLIARSMAKNNSSNKSIGDLSSLKTSAKDTLVNSVNESFGIVNSLSTNPTFKTSDDTKSASLGSELIDATGWTVPDGWTGDFSTGFVNTVGNLNPLTKMLASTGTKLYQLSFRIESPSPAGVPNASTDFTVSIGNSEPFITYQGGGNFNYTFGIQSVSNGNLVFTPGATFNGTIKNVSIKEIVGTVSPSLQVSDGQGNNVLEVRTSSKDLLNKFIGKDSGKSNTTGKENVSLGDLSLVKNTTGYWNTALGKDSLGKNTVGSRNVAVGFLALNENVSGDRNIAIGTFTLQRNTTGRQNIALGADCLWVNTTGSRNIAMGMGTMGSSTTGNENVAIGYSAMEGNQSGSNNVAIGFNALYDNQTSDNNVAIGREALKKTTAGVNVGIGYGALSYNTTGISNTAIGYNALSRTKLGSENAVFGHYAAASGTFGDGISKSAIFGAWAGNKLATGANNNTMVGYGAGRNITTGTNNILIGYNVAQELIAESNVLNIGNVLYGKLNSSVKQFGIGISSPTAALHLPASNGGTGSAPLKLEAGSLLAVKESNTIEYDGNDLYFTDKTGARYKLSKVAV